MTLPFTHDMFLDVFGAYNQALLVWVIGLWVLTAGTMAVLARRGAAADRLVAAVLALHWLWSAVVYHIGYFRAINPAAVGFAAFFLGEAALFAWLGVVRRELRFGPAGGAWDWLALGLIAYALAYPFLGLALGLHYPRLPTFGVPCPTTILTLGLLLRLPRRPARWLAFVPVLWSIVGGSAAFLLGIRADLMLPVAGAILVVDLLRPGRKATA